MDFKLPTRPQNSNKSTFGKVLNVAGSRYTPGAAYLSSASALTVGCGYVILACEDEVCHSVSALSPDIIFAPQENLPEADVLSIGCGLSTLGLAVEVFRAAIAKNLPTIIDADGLNILAKIEVKLPEKVILTPHPKEASRLLGIDLAEVLEDTEGSAKKICAKYNCVTVLKTNQSLVCTAEGRIYQNKTGNSALAKAGSGDILTGIIAGLLAQKMEVFEAACLGCHLHGLAGELASKDLTEYGVCASDLIKYIPAAIKSIKE